MRRFRILAKIYQYIMLYIELVIKSTFYESHGREFLLNIRPIRLEIKFKNMKNLSPLFLLFLF